MQRRTPPAMRRRIHLTATALLAALVLAACADGNDTAGTNEAENAATGNGGEVGEGPAEEAPVSGDETAEQAPAVQLEELAAEDGWNGDLHDLEFPGPGQGVLHVAGETIALTITCDGPGVVAQPGYPLFRFTANGEGEDSDGRQVTTVASRELVDTEEASTSFYEYKGQERGSVRITVAVGDGTYNSSIIVTPADNDPTGAGLPVVQVEQDGRFSVDEDVPALPMFHDEAMGGPAQLSGQCPDTWPEDSGS